MRISSLFIVLCASFVLSATNVHAQPAAPPPTPKVIKLKIGRDVLLTQDVTVKSGTIGKGSVPPKDWTVKGAKTADGIDLFTPVFEAGKQIGEDIVLPNTDTVLSKGMLLTGSSVFEMLEAERAKLPVAPKFYGGTELKDGVPPSPVQLYVELERAKVKLGNADAATTDAASALSVANAAKKTVDALKAQPPRVIEKTVVEKTGPSAAEIEAIVAKKLAEQKPVVQKTGLSTNEVKALIKEQVDPVKKVGDENSKAIKDLQKDVEKLKKTGEKLQKAEAKVEDLKQQVANAKIPALWYSWEYCGGTTEHQGWVYDHRGTTSLGNYQRSHKKGE